MVKSGPVFCSLALHGFFLKILPLKDDEFLERTYPKKYLNLNKLGFVCEEGHSGGKSQNIAIKALKGIFPATYGLNVHIKQI